MRNPACEEGKGAVLGADGPVPEFARMLPRDKGIGVVNLHKDHDQPAQAIYSTKSGHLRRHASDCSEGTKAIELHTR